MYLVETLFLQLENQFIKLAHSKDLYFEIWTL